jgi:hypothetical protein
MKENPIAVLRFIGKDSLGYKKGEIYTIEYHISDDGSVIIRRSGDSGNCVYSNIISFIRNWAIIK